MENIHETEDVAFVGSKAGFELFGTPLKPYSPSRKVAAQSMGMLYPYIGEDAAAQFASTGVYPGALKDCIILLWLCSIEDAKDQTKDNIRSGAWNPSRALHKPHEALETAMAWAGELEICNIGGTRFGEAFKVFIEIATAVEASKFSIAVEGATQGGDAGPNV